MAKRVFDPGDPQHARNVRRHIEVEWPDEYDLQLQPLEEEPNLEDPNVRPPSYKGIKKLVRTVFHPRVTRAGQELTSFTTPIKLTVHYTAEDTTEVPPAQLFLVTYYKHSDGRHRWEKLPTTVDTATRTLKADLYTLAPADPVGVGH